MKQVTWWAVMVVALAFGCAGGGEASGDGPASEDSSGSAEVGDDTAGPEHCAGGFVAGVGGPDQVCAAMIGGCCYESTGDACDAMDCPGQCQASDAVPAEISCQ